MKKLIAFLVLAVIPWIAQAQLSTFDEPITFSINGGGNLSNFTGDLDLDMALSYNVGLGVDFNLAKFFGIQTGLSFVLKEAKAKNENSKDKKDIRLEAGYLQIPLVLSLRFRVGENTRIDFNAGCYGAYGILGETNGIINEDKTFSDGAFKRLDYGIALGTRINFSDYYLNAMFEKGLANISDSPNTDIKTMNISLSLGYTF